MSSTSLRGLTRMTMTTRVVNVLLADQDGNGIVYLEEQSEGPGPS